MTFVLKIFCHRLQSRMYFFCPSSPHPIPHPEICFWCAKLCPGTWTIVHEGVLYSRRVGPDVDDEGTIAETAA